MLIPFQIIHSSVWDKIRFSARVKEKIFAHQHTQQTSAAWTNPTHISVFLLVLILGSYTM